MRCEEDGRRFLNNLMARKGRETAGAQMGEWDAECGYFTKWFFLYFGLLQTCKQQKTKKTI